MLLACPRVMTFLLEAAAAVWGMDLFNEYLKGKCFILYTDHKPLEKLGHLHSKTLNRLQTALLEHDFIIQYKKGSNMLADYLSRLSGAKDADANIKAFDPFQANLYDLQLLDETLQMLQNFWANNEWLSHLSKQDQDSPRQSISRQKLVWVCLDNFKYPSTALYLPAVTGMKQCAKPTMESLEATTPCTRPT